jgi:type VI protein secretion system component VasF
MTELDPMLRALAALRAAAPSAELSQKLRAAAHARLIPAKVHPAWSVAVAASVVAYLGWALAYTSLL